MLIIITIAGDIWIPLHVSTKTCARYSSLNKKLEYWLGSSEAKCLSLSLTGPGVQQSLGLPKRNALNKELFFILTLQNFENFS